MCARQLIQKSLPVIRQNRECGKENRKSRDAAEKKSHLPKEEKLVRELRRPDAVRTIAEKQPARLELQFTDMNYNSSYASFSPKSP